MKVCRFFEIYILKLLKKIREDKGITIDCKIQLNNFLIILVNEICKKCNKIIIISSRRTLTEEDILNISNIIFDNDLYVKVVNNAINAIDIFKNNVKDKVCKSRQNYANIIFPVSVVERILRENLSVGICLTGLTSLCLTSVIETVATEILLESSVNNTKIRITIKDVEYSRNNKSLNNLYNKFNVYFIGGGSISCISYSIVNKSVLKNIKSLQKSTLMIIPKITFEKLVRSILTRLSVKEIKISKDFCIVLQSIIEQYIINFIKKANLVCINSNRVTLMESDLLLIKSLEDHQY